MHKAVSVQHEQPRERAQHSGTDLALAVQPLRLVQPGTVPPKPWGVPTPAPTSAWVEVSRGLPRAARRCWANTHRPLRGPNSEVRQRRHCHLGQAQLLVAASIGEHVESTVSHDIPCDPHVGTCRTATSSERQARVCHHTHACAPFTSAAADSACTARRACLWRRPAAISGGMPPAAAWHLTTLDRAAQTLPCVTAYHFLCILVRDATKGTRAVLLEVGIRRVNQAYNDR